MYPYSEPPYVVIETACEACGEVNTHLTSMCPVVEGFIGAAVDLARTDFPGMDKFAIFLGFGEAHVQFAVQAPA